MKAKKRNIIIALLLSSLCFSACNQDKLLKITIERSGKNKAELEKVLEHYKNEPEKLEAAKFLIRNMSVHVSYYGDEIEDFYRDTKNNVLSMNVSPEEQHDIVLAKSRTQYKTIQEKSGADSFFIKADYLINSIDQAFDQWKNRSWCKHLTFDEFCEWLLPYKVADYQKLDYWRDSVTAFFTDTLNRLSPYDPNGRSIIRISEAVRTEIVNKIKPRVIWGVTHGYNLYSSDLYSQWTYGTCEEYVNLGVMTFRSIGIPAVIDEVPVWGRKNWGHTWYTILTDNGRELSNADCIISPIGFGSFYPYERFPKVFRRSFSINPDVLEYQEKAKFKYEFDLCRQDVTDKYCVTSDIDIVINNKINKDKYVYLSMLVNRGAPEWQIIDFGKVKHKKACFSKVGRNNMYLIMGYNGQSIVPISDPFILKKDGTIQYIKYDSEKTQSVQLKRKYFESYNVVMQRRRILGAQIQCADKPDFSDCTTVYTIESTDIPYLIKLGENGKHRYWRYLSADGTYGSIAELSFHDNNGNIIEGTPIACAYASKDAANNAFDNNWLSNFETSEWNDNWVGMDMVNPIRVASVRVIPRNDDNDICPGNEYELLYWNGSFWDTLGKQCPEANYLNYDNVPVGSLLWVKNYTRGTDECSFFFNENGEIEWW